MKICYDDDCKAINPIDAISCIQCGINRFRENHHTQSGGNVNRSASNEINDLRKTVHSDSNIGISNDPIRKTSVGQQQFQSARSSEIIHCKECGTSYPINLANCPSKYCNNPNPDLGVSEKSQHDNLKKTQKFDNEPVQPEQVHLTLEPIDGDGKTLQLNLDQEASLSRKDIDLNDSMISREEHLIIKKEDEKILIENRSSNQALFVQVKTKAEITNGDIILIGTNQYYKVTIHSDG